MKLENPVPVVRITGIIEGISYIILMGIAVPLKWKWGMPLAVKIIGPIHGLLFFPFCAALVWAYAVAKWSAGRAIIVFIASLIPFGFCFVDKPLRRWAAEFAASRTNKR